MRSPPPFSGGTPSRLAGIENGATTSGETGVNQMPRESIAVRRLEEKVAITQPEATEDPGASGHPWSFSTTINWRKMGSPRCVFK